MGMSPRRSVNYDSFCVISILTVETVTLLYKIIVQRETLFWSTIIGIPEGYRRNLFHFDWK